MSSPAKPIAIGTDHGGYVQKKDLIEQYTAKGYQFLDCGTCAPDSTDYPIYAARVAMLVSQGHVQNGILLCRSGIGMSIMANRFPGVRAALVSSPETARLSRTHNNANVIVLGSDHLSHPVSELIEIFFSTEFESGGRHERRVEMIDDLRPQSTEVTEAYQSIQDWVDANKP